jgi:carbonic anhydrase/acetyltransferase-like protein (isoleucine patch superfamily)
MPIYALGEKTPSAPAGLCWVAPTAVIIGDVRLEEGASVWFGATLRADNEPIIVGPGSNIQENSVLHVDPGFPLTIGAHCTIGHAAILHGCTIGDGALIGMGATILNGVKIGRNCIVGANALITEGKEIPDNSLVVGAPARVIRQVDEKAAANILRISNNYAARWKRYAADLREVAP